MNSIMKAFMKAPIMYFNRDGSDASSSFESTMMFDSTVTFTQSKQGRIDCISPDHALYFKCSSLYMTNSGCTGPAKDISTSCVLEDRFFHTRASDIQLRVRLRRINSSTSFSVYLPARSCHTGAANADPDFPQFLSRVALFRRHC